MHLHTLIFRCIKIGAIFSRCIFRCKTPFTICNTGHHGHHGISCSRFFAVTFSNKSTSKYNIFLDPFYDYIPLIFGHQNTTQFCDGEKADTIWTWAGVGSFAIFFLITGYLRRRRHLKYRTITSDPYGIC